MKNAYVEITNCCNLNCDFCPGHSRKPKHMSAREFETVLDKLEGRVENLFLHVMGEPLLHPEFDEIIALADKTDLKLKITTNGTLLSSQIHILERSKNLHTVFISIHSFGGTKEGSGSEKSTEEYICQCFDASRRLAAAGKFAVLRLWNLEEGGSSPLNEYNQEVLKLAEKYFPPQREEWVKTHRGQRIATHVFIEWGERFDWPDPEKATEAPSYEGEYGCENCHALLTQFGVLSDGTVVPCCLDRNGDIPLGNIFESEYEEIMAEERAKKMKEAMAHHRFIEPLCKSCGFKRNIKKK